MSTKVDVGLLDIRWVLGTRDDSLLPSTETLRLLISEASRVRLNAHVPASGFRVGSALLCEDGEMFTGCNVEASNGQSVCAERTAIAKAISEGHSSVRIVVAVGDTPVPITPCGQCRQQIADIAPEAVVVMVTTRHAHVEVARISELFPRSNFKSGNAAVQSRI